MAAANVTNTSDTVVEKDVERFVRKQVRKALKSSGVGRTAELEDGACRSALERIVDNLPSGALQTTIKQDVDKWVRYFQRIVKQCMEGGHGKREGDPHNRSKRQKGSGCKETGKSSDALGHLEAALQSYKHGRMNEAQESLCQYAAGSNRLDLMERCRGNCGDGMRVVDCLLSSAALLTSLSSTQGASSLFIPTLDCLTALAQSHLSVSNIAEGIFKLLDRFACVISLHWSMRDLSMGGQMEGLWVSILVLELEVLWMHMKMEAGGKVDTETFLQNGKKRCKQKLAMFGDACLNDLYEVLILDQLPLSLAPEDCSAHIWMALFESFAAFEMSSASDRLYVHKIALARRSAAMCAVAGDLRSAHGVDWVKKVETETAPAGFMSWLNAQNADGWVGKLAKKSAPTVTKALLRKIPDALLKHLANAWVRQENLEVPSNEEDGQDEEEQMCMPEGQLFFVDVDGNSMAWDLGEKENRHGSLDDGIGNGDSDVDGDESDTLLVEVVDSEEEG